MAVFTGRCSCLLFKSLLTAGKDRRPFFYLCLYVPTVLLHCPPQFPPRQKPTSPAPTPPPPLSSASAGSAFITVPPPPHSPFLQGIKVIAQMITQSPVAMATLSCDGDRHAQSTTKTAISKLVMERASALYCLYFSLTSLSRSFTSVTNWIVNHGNEWRKEERGRRQWKVTRKATKS